MMYSLLYPFLYSLYLRVTTSHKMLFSYITMCSLSCSKDFFKNAADKNLIICSLKTN